MVDKLRLMQANLNKAKASVESALQLAVELAVDLIVVQEPMVITEDGMDYSNCRSINHPSFSQLFPQHLPSSLRPRVMLYISRSLNAQVNCINVANPHPDVQWVKVQSRSFNFTICNIYNERGREGYTDWTIERGLLPHTVNTPTLVLGDLNLHHPAWEPSTDKSSTLSKAFYEWTQDQQLELLNEPGVGTFFRANMSEESVLDLTFATSDLAARAEDWQVLPDSGSDHHAIMFTLSASVTDTHECPNPATRYNTRKADWDSFTGVFSDLVASEPAFQELHNFPLASPALSKALLKGEAPDLQTKLDALGDALSNTINAAASTTIPRMKQGHRSKPWWNDDLKRLRGDMNNKQRRYVLERSRCSTADCFLWKRDYLLSRNTYFQEIKTAKRDHWNQFLEKEDAQSIFKAMSYTKNSTSQRIPPIRSPTALEESFDGKCAALRQTLFPPPPHTTLPDWDRYSPRASSWEWPPLSRIEVHEACSPKVKSKTPGPDNITQDMIIAAYRAEPDLLFRVFSVFFNYGYHPRCWKQATGVILKKPGKPDYSAPKAYRVISLLNCLGKVLERMLAMRLGALAEVTQLLHPSQIGGRRRKSAVDAGLLLLNEVQQQRRLGRHTSTVLLDIKGAFDHVALNQLLNVMASLELPYSLISWTQSFLTDRLLRLSFDGESQEFSPIESGIPQGSPISPILFLIYIRDLFTSVSNFSLSYMDDLSISASSTSLQKNVRTLSRVIGALFSKGEETAIQFDPAKTELIHFTTSKKATSAVLTLPDQTIIKPKKVVRWLGIHFDDALSFKQHINIRAGQATAAFHRMCRLANKERGLSPFAMRQLYMACITSVADFGSPVVWKGQASARDRLQSLQNTALQRILGTFRTSPIRPMEVEAALPPPEVRLNTNIRQYAFRARKLPPSHPIHEALHRIWSPPINLSDSSDSERSNAPKSNGATSQMERIADSIMRCLSYPEEQISHDQFRPWQRHSRFDVVISALPKDEEAKSHNEYMLSRLGSNLLAIYCDASSVPKGTGIGVAFSARDYSGNSSEVHYHMSNLGKGQIVYNGELEGIARSFEYAADVATSGQEIRIHADNQAAIYRIKNPSDMPGQAWQLRCFSASQRIVEKGATVSLHWVPGHKDVEGNERADGLAKMAAKMTPQSNLTSLALTGIRIKNTARVEWGHVYLRYKASTVRDKRSSYATKFDLAIRKRILIPTGTKRLLASTFYQLKLGHGYFKQYLARVNKSDTPRCSCGAIQSPEHLLLSCKWLRTERKMLMEELEENDLSLTLLLHTSVGVAATLRFLDRTKVATRKWQLGDEEV